MTEKRLSLFSQVPPDAPSRSVYGMGIVLDHHAAGIDGISLASPDDAENHAVMSIPDGVRAVHFREAYSDPALAAIIRERFMSTITSNGDVPAALSAATFLSGLLIIVPERAIVHEPIRIRRDLSCGVQKDHLLVVAGKESVSALIVESSGGSKTQGADIAPTHTETIEIIAMDGSRVHCISIVDMDDESRSVRRKGACVMEDASVLWTECCTGGTLQQSFTSTELAGKGAVAAAQGLFFGVGTELFDIKSTASHRAAHTTSTMLLRTVLDGNSKAILRSGIAIGSDAPKSVAHQKSDALLLGEGSAADAVPSLDVHNDDVRCGHAASIGQIDSERLFYLMSRGLDRTDAVRHIVKGFFEPIIRGIDDAPLCDAMHTILEHRLSDVKVQG